MCAEPPDLTLSLAPMEHMLPRVLHHPFPFLPPQLTHKLESVEVDPERCEREVPEEEAAQLREGFEQKFVSAGAGATAR